MSINEIGSSASGTGIVQLTGDVTAGPGTGSQAATIPNDTVTNAKMANMVQATVKGRASGAGTGDPTDLTGTQATVILDAMVGDSGAGGTKGLAPAPSAGDAAAGKYLGAGGTWSIPAGGGTSGIDTLTGDVTAGPGSGSQAATIANDAVSNAKLANMATARFKGRTTGGTGDPEDLTATQATALLDNMVGDSGAGGTKGLVPAPAAGDAAAAKFLKADGSWTVPSGSGGITQLTGEVTTAAGSGAQAATIATTGTPQVLRLGIGTAADSSAALKVNGQLWIPMVDKGSGGAAVTINWNDGNEQKIYLTANLTLTLSNPKDGGRYVLRLLQNTTGGWTVTWPGTVLWPSGATPTITATASKGDLVTLLYDTAGAVYWGSINQNY